jgi:hypothetical protein
MPRRPSETKPLTDGDLVDIRAALKEIKDDVATIKVEMAETRGAWRLAKFIVAILGVSGLGGITAWLAGQGK